MAERVPGQAKIRDVASKALVSIGTVSRVLNNHPNVEPDLRMRVLEAVNELGYVHRPRQTYRFIMDDDVPVKSEISHIAFCCRRELVTTGISNPYFSLVLQGVEAECRKHNLHLIYNIAEDHADELARAKQMLRASGAEAVLLVNFINEELVGGLLDLNLPMVLIDHCFPDLPLDAVMNDSYHGAMRAVQHLIRNGHRRIGFVDGLPHYTIQLRFDAYRRAIDDAGLIFDPAAVLPGDLNYEGGLRAAEEFIRRGLDCTAVFCANDQLAFGFVQGLALQGVRVPEDVSVVGFDDVEAARLISPPLTTVRANAPSLGRIAVRRILDRVADPTLPITQTVVRSELVERRSVRSLH